MSILTVVGIEAGTPFSDKLGPLNLTLFGSAYGRTLIGNGLKIIGHNTTPLGQALLLLPVWNILSVVSDLRLKRSALIGRHITNIKSTIPIVSHLWPGLKGLLVRSNINS